MSRTTPAMLMRGSMSIVAVMLLSAGSALGEPCPEGEWCQWTEAEGGSGHWYRLTDTWVSWSDAEAEAIEVCGGHLVTINDGDENAWILEQFGQFGQQGEGFNGLWIGFYQDTADQDCTPNCEPAEGWKWIKDPSLCRWQTGNPDICYTNWYSNEPNNAHSGEDHAYMYNNYTPDRIPGTWNDLDQSDVAPGIIECIRPPIPAVSQWGIVVMTLLVLIAGTLVLTRRRVAM